MVGKTSLKHPCPGGSFSAAGGLSPGCPALSREKEVHGNTVGINPIPLRLEAPERSADGRTGGGDPRIPDSNTVKDRRPPGPEPGRGGADDGAACCLEHSRRQDHVRREPSGLCAQNSHRPPRPSCYYSPTGRT